MVLNLPEMCDWMKGDATNTYSLDLTPVLSKVCTCLQERKTNIKPFLEVGMAFFSAIMIY